MSACPTCGKPVDALRAPAAKVRDGKIVAYCSKECADAGESKPVELAKQPAPTKIVKKTPATGVPQSAKDLDSGPVIEIIREKSAPAEKPKRKERPDTDGAIEIADTGHVDDYVDPDPPRRHTARIVVLVLVLVVAGGVLAAYQLGWFDSALGRAATSPPPPPPAPVKIAEPPSPPPAVTPDAAVAKAKTTLQTLMQSTTPRVQRVAAAALSRTADADAIAVLTAAAVKEDSDIGKLDDYYALARAGDKKGLDALVAGLSSQRRDPRLEAARRLAMLGDKRAVPVLTEYLEVSQLRLGAAIELAHLSDPTGLDVLDKLRKDDKASPDDRARATVALGIAGKAEMSEPLRALLSDPREDAFAANALAALHDPAARPVLEKLLAVPSLRVQAARALRRLDAELDAKPLLPGLLDALGSAKDTEQAQAAEAILLLAGPAAWSEHE